MARYVLAFDLGTGGCKASLWSDAPASVAEAVVGYPTSHPAPGRAEQRPDDWWDAVVGAARAVFAERPDLAGAVEGIALSGQSLGVVQVDDRGGLVAPVTPIWSDARGRTTRVFEAVPEPAWYRRTGNGFGAELYPLFKVEALRAEDPDGWRRTRHLLGSKDWINLRLTGEVATDHSMASGSGAYSLAAGGYDDELLAAGGLERALLPEPRESSDVIGHLTAEAAATLGIAAGVPVLAGAVDNAAMALGSRGTAEGRIYASLGSSSWMTVTSARPVLDDEARPYVFRHAVPGFHVSALSTFSSGTSLTWLRDLLAPGEDVGVFVERAMASPVGANGVLFLPTLAGGTPLEGGPGARGGFAGLALGTTEADLVRASLEGIAFALRRSLDRIRRLSGSAEPLLVSGGGSRPGPALRITADVLGTELVRTRVDQQAATLGAAAVAFVGLGIWRDHAEADRAHEVVEHVTPDADAARRYDLIRPRFDAALAALATLPPCEETP